MKVVLNVALLTLSHPPHVRKLKYPKYHVGNYHVFHACLEQQKD